MIDELIPYIDSNRIAQRVTNHNGQDYELYCYTKNQFHEWEWDEVTIKHRGKIYRDGKAINAPFDKIFNMNEQDSTSEENIDYLILTQPFEVLDKVNGHLTIVSHDIELGNVLVTTKGSFGGELADLDCELMLKMKVDEAIKHNCLNYTFMFECLASYDQHLWYDEARRIYNTYSDTFILLGATCNVTGKSVAHDTLSHFAHLFNLPVVRRFRQLEGVDVSLDNLFTHTMTEGYVFHFINTGFRFKIKTSEYVRLRYMSDVKAERIVNVLYRSGKENMYAEFDEELHVILDAVIQDLNEFYMNNCVDYELMEQAKGWTNREIAECKGLNALEKSHLLSSGGMAMYSKTVRTLFKASNHYPNTDKAIKVFFEKNLFSK